MDATERRRSWCEKAVRDARMTVFDTPRMTVRTATTVRKTPMRPVQTWRLPGPAVARPDHPQASPGPACNRQEAAGPGAPAEPAKGGPIGSPYPHPPPPGHPRRLPRVRRRRGPDPGRRRARPAPAPAWPARRPPRRASPPPQRSLTPRPARQALPVGRHRPGRLRLLWAGDGGVRLGRGPPRADLTSPVGHRAARVQPAAGRPGVLPRCGRHLDVAGARRPGGRPRSDDRGVRDRLSGPAGPDPAGGLGYGDPVAAS